MTKLKRKIALIMAVVMMFSVVSMSASAVEISNNENINIPKIETLIEQRAVLISSSEIDTKALDEIDLKLSNLGVEFMTDQQVSRQFPEIKTDEVLAKSGQTKTIQPRAALPTSKFNTWISYRTSNYLYNGKRYNIQTLVAHPNDFKSPLYDSGLRAVKYSKNWKAGAENAVKSVGMSAAGAIPGASIYVSVYDAVSAFISGISSTTEVKSPDITYEWLTTTTATFEYVRLESQSDSSQWLSYINTKVMGEVSYRMATASYKKSGGSWIFLPKFIDGKSRVYAQPPLTVPNPACYAYVSGKMIDERVRSVVISGPESKTVQTIYPVFPNFPMQCE